MNYSVIILLALVATACSEATNKKTDPIVFLENPDTLTAETSAGQELLEVHPPGLYTNTDTNEIAIITRPGSYHYDEFDEAYIDNTWYGIFDEGEGWYLEKTELICTREYDPILDGDESIKTGWKIETKNSVTCLLVLSGIEFEKSQVKEQKLDASELYPGDTLRFEFNEKQYTLFATGRTEKDLFMEGYNIVDYKLFLQAEKNGEMITELLVAHENFDENMVDILFAGDIDGDDLPDFIIDASRHYNATNPALYLSSYAKAHQLLQLVGWRLSVGC